MLEKLQTKIDNIVFEDNQLKCYSDNNLIDTIYIDNVDEAVVRDVVETYMADFRDEMSDKLEDYIDEEDLDYLIISL